MTFAIAGFTPYPFLEGVPRGFLAENGIAFVTDTRYITTSEIFDHGCKLAVLTDTAVGVLAGDVLPAMSALAEAQEFFDHSPLSEREFVEQELKGRLNAVAGHYRRVLPKEPDFAIAIGYLANGRQPALLSFGPPASPLHLATPWGFVLGKTELLPDYEEGMRSLVNDLRRDGGSIALGPRDWAVNYAAAFHRSLLTEALALEVGGGLQVAVLTPEDGAHSLELRHTRVASGADLSAPASWTPLTREVFAPHPSGELRKVLPE